MGAQHAPSCFRYNKGTLSNTSCLLQIQGGRGTLLVGARIAGELSVVGRRTTAGRRIWARRRAEGRGTWERQPSIGSWTQAHRLSVGKWNQARRSSEGRSRQQTGALACPAASAGAHKPVPSTSIIVQHASSAPLFSDELPVSRSLWVKLLSRPRGASSFQERGAAVAREIKNLHSGSILSQTPRLNRNQ